MQRYSVWRGGETHASHVLRSDRTRTQWFDQRTQGTGPNRRARRIAIVAVARRLAIALWRYLKDGVIPEGAHLKSA